MLVFCLLKQILWFLRQLIIVLGTKQHVCWSRNNIFFAIHDGYKEINASQVTCSNYLITCLISLEYRDAERFCVMYNELPLTSEQVENYRYRTHNSKHNGIFSLQYNIKLFPLPYWKWSHSIRSIHKCWIGKQTITRTIYQNNEHTRQISSHCIHTHILLWFFYQQ